MSEQTTEPSPKRRLDRVLLVSVLLMQVVVMAALAAFYFDSRRQHEGVGSPPDANARQPPSGALVLPPDPLPSSPATPAADAFAQFHDEMMHQMQHMMQWSDGFGPATHPTPATAGPNPPVRNGSMSQFMAEALQDFHELEEMVASDRGWGLLVRSPTLDMRDMGTNYLVLCSLPGLEKTDVSVTLEGRLLTIVGQSSTQARPSYHSSRFERQIWLPGPVDGERGRASLSNGILHVLVPKAVEMAANPVTERLL